MSKVMISLPETFLRDVDTLAEAEHRSRSELVREAIRTYVATRRTSGAGSLKASGARAASRILKTHLQFPEGQTAESIIRTMRSTRYGSGWKNS